METQVLIDPLVEPDDKVLKHALGEKYNLYKTFSEKIGEQNLTIEWNYYKDGKSWLGKILNKKKNICWLSVWDTGFRLTFYFTNKTIDGLNELSISDEIKKQAIETKPIGKLIPVIMQIGSKSLIDDGLKILDYKRQVK